MNKNGPDLLSLLRENAASGTVPMHMPGHKRNPACAGFLEGLSLRHDITEIDGFDNLHGAEGILKEAMECAAALWGTKRSYYLVNGSSGGILSAIRALTKRGDSVLMSRFSHKSVYHSVEMCGLRPSILCRRARRKRVCMPQFRRKRYRRHFGRIRRFASSFSHRLPTRV